MLPTWLKGNSSSKLYPMGAYMKEKFDFARVASSSSLHNEFSSAALSPGSQHMQQCVYASLTFLFFPASFLFAWALWADKEKYIFKVSLFWKALKRGHFFLWHKAVKNRPDVLLPSTIVNQQLKAFVCSLGGWIESSPLVLCPAKPLWNSK